MTPVSLFFLLFLSILGCPIARKRRLEEAELEQEQQDAEKPAPKRKAHPLKMALDEGFSAESDGSSEAEGEEPAEAKAEPGDGEEEQREQQEAKEDGGEVAPELKNGHVDETVKEEEQRKEHEEASQEEETPAAGWSQSFPRQTRPAGAESPSNHRTRNEPQTRKKLIAVLKMCIF